MTVGWRPNHQFRSDVAARAGTIFDDEVLFQILAQFGRHDARHHVGRGAGRETEDQSHRPCGIATLAEYRERRGAGDTCRKGERDELHESSESGLWAAGPGCRLILGFL